MEKTQHLTVYNSSIGSSYDDTPKRPMTPIEGVMVEALIETPRMLNKMIETVKIFDKKLDESAEGLHHSNEFKTAYTEAVKKARNRTMKPCVKTAIVVIAVTTIVTLGTYCSKFIL